MTTYYQFSTIFDSSNKQAENASIVKHDLFQVLEGKIDLANMIFRVKKGFEKFDFLDTEQTEIYLCKGRVVAALKDADITGWKATPVTLEYKKERVQEPYYIFHVYGKCGPFDYSKSEVINIDYSFVELKGRYFDDSAVDTDIFVIDKTAMIFVNEKVKKLLVERQFSNVELKANSEIVSSIPRQLYNQRTNP